MNFGGFAGGFSQGFNNGMAMGKNIRDAIKERKLQDLREQGMAEAEAARGAAVQSMIKDNGMPDAPKSGPVDNSQPKVETPKPAEEAAGATPSPVREGAVESRPLPPIGTSTPSATPAATTPAAGAAGMSSGNPYGPNYFTVADQHRMATGSTPAAPQPETTPSAAAAAEPAAPAAGATPSATPATPATPADSGATPATPAKPATPASPQAAAASGMPQGRYVVNGIGYETRELAKAAAEKSAPSAQDFFMKNAVPKLAQAYVTNGDPEKAKAWTDYAESHNGKRAIKDWSAAYSAPDFDTAVSRFGKYYTDHINDGVDYTGHKMKVGADGTQVAVVGLKDKASGKTLEMELTREKMLALGSANNPQKLFEQEVAKQASADKIKLEASIKAQDRRDRANDSLTLEKYKQDRLDGRESVKSKNEANKVNVKLDAQVGALRDAGYADDDIKRMMPALVGAADHKKTTDPTERRALIASDLLKNDPRFGRMTKDDQNKRIDDMMGVIYGDEKPAAKEGAKPAVATAPMKYDPKLPVKYQKGTGKPFHLVNGQYVPIDGMPPAAGGLPKQ